MQRGPAPAEQQGWAAEPTAPAGRRLPGPARERRPALAALAVLLIVGGALGAGFLTVRSGQRVAAIEVTQQIGAGQKIPRSALQQAQVAADSGVQYVSWIYAGNVAQDYAATTIPAGTLLSKAMVAPTGAVLSGREVVGLALKDGQWPPQLSVGDHVAIYATSSQNGAAGGCHSGGGLTLAGDASVVSVSTSGSGGLLSSAQSGGSTDVTVAVSPADAGPVACYAAAGQVAVALLPPGGRAAAAPVTAPGGQASGNGAAPGGATPTLTPPASGPSRKPSASHSPALRSGHG